MLRVGYPARVELSTAASRKASRHWWDLDADNYQAEHGDFLGDVDFVWCPEGLREADVHLLGDVAGRRILEVGCGAAAAARWLVTQGADVVAVDLSAGMLRHAVAAAERTGIHPALIQCDAMSLPFADATFDIAFTAFGAVPFVDDSAVVMAEVFRVLRPGGLWTFSVTHPVRWIFLDDPGRTASSRCTRTSTAAHTWSTTTPAHPSTSNSTAPLVTASESCIGAGFTISDLVEPEWPENHEQVWGQWSPERGRLFPGTAIYATTKPR